jgi:predicted permease
VLLLGLDSRGTSYEERGIGPLIERLLEGLRQLPGVRAATISSMVPLFGGNMWAVEIGGPGVSGTAQTWARINAVVPGYLGTLGIPLLEGRDLASGDGAGAPVALVSEAFAHRYFGNADPLGRSFGARLEGDSLQEFRIVGVAGNAKYANLRDTPDPLVYLPLLTRDRWTSLSVTIRTAGDPMALVPAARQAMDTAVPGLRVRRISEMRIQLGEARSIERLAAELAGFASGMAIVLAMMGLYGVVAHGVTRRTRELGIRRALGAQSGEIIRLVAGELTGIVAIGLTLGLGLSFLAAQAIRSQLYGVAAHDPAVMLGSVALLIGAMGLAAAAPTRRAVRVDPRIALIAE